MNDDLDEWWRLDYPIQGLSQPVKRLISQRKVKMPKKDRSTFSASACIEVSLAKKGRNAQEGQEFLKCDVDSDTFDLQNGSDQ